VGVELHLFLTLALVVRFMPPYPMNRQLDRDPMIVCKFWSNIKNHLSLLGIGARFLGWPNSNAVTVPSLLSRLLLCLEGNIESSNRFSPTEIYLWDK